jgi:WD40 repeat protein
VDTGKQVKEFEDRKDWISGIAVSPDGGRAVSGAHNSLVHLWDLQTGKELRRFEATDSAVAFGPDGRHVRSGGNDTKVRLWDAETGKEIRQLLGNTRNLDSLAFSPDGQRALSGGTDGTIRLWDLATGKELHRFEKFQAPGIGPGIVEPISCVYAAFSPDGHYAFSGGMDGICRLWRLPDLPAAKDKP